MNGGLIRWSGKPGAGKICPGLARQWESMKKPLAVIVVRRQLGALQTGANVYLSVLLTELRTAGFSVHLVFAPDSSFGSLPVAAVGRHFRLLCDGLSWPRTLRAGRYVLSLSPRVYFRFLRRLWREVSHRFFGQRLPTRLGRVSEPLNPAEAVATAATVNALAADLVVVEYSALGPVLGEIKDAGVVKGVLLHDLFSMRAQAMRDLERSVDFADMTLEEEAALCKAADLLIYASQAEREVFRPLLPDRAHVWLAPNCKASPAIAPSSHPKALFMGVRHSGNLDAIEFLMEEIWPRVIARKADAELWIIGEIGASMRPEWRRMSGVKVLGILANLEPFGGPDTIGLAPTRVASGISIKLADYMRLNMAVLASDVALEGYGSLLDGFVDTANSAEEFADRLVVLLSESDQRYTLAGRSREEGLQAALNPDLRAELEKISKAAAVDVHSTDQG